MPRRFSKYKWNALSSSLVSRSGDIRGSTLIKDNTMDENMRISSCFSYTWRNNPIKQPFSFFIFEKKYTIFKRLNKYNWNNAKTLDNWTGLKIFPKYGYNWGWFCGIVCILLNVTKIGLKTIETYRKGEGSLERFHGAHSSQVSP